MLVDIKTLALHIGGIGAAAVWPLVPIEAEPEQVAQHAFSRVRTDAREIEVFDAQDKLASRAAGVEPRQQRRAQIAQVQVSRWAGGVSSSYRCITYLRH